MLVVLPVTGSEVRNNLHHHVNDITSKIHFCLKGFTKRGGLNVAHGSQFSGPCFETTVIYYFFMILRVDWVVLLDLEEPIYVIVFS